MIDHVWLITDAATGDLSYVTHGKEGEEADWKKVGPFSFTSHDAVEDAAANPKFLPEGVDAQLSFVEVEASAFVQAIFNGFAPANTDVLVLDDGFFPLTSGGAGWVDLAIGVPVWGPVFDESGDGIGLGWLNRVLRQVAGRLDMKMETVQAIGTLNAAAEDDAVEDAEVNQSGPLIQKHVRVVIKPEPGTLVIKDTDENQVLSSASLFWLHTQGMDTFGLPELEIRSVPCRWVTSAIADLMNWAVYSIDKGLCEGDTIVVEGPVPLTLRVVAASYETRECLRLEVSQAVFPVGHQRHGGPEGPKMLH